MGATIIFSEETDMTTQLLPFKNKNGKVIGYWLPQHTGYSWQFEEHFDLNGDWYAHNLESIGKGRYRLTVETMDGIDDERTVEGDYDTLACTDEAQGVGDFDSVIFGLALFLGDQSMMNRLVLSEPLDFENRSADWFETRYGRAYMKLHLMRGTDEPTEMTIQEAMAKREERLNTLKPCALSCDCIEEAIEILKKCPAFELDGKEIRFGQQRDGRVFVGFGDEHPEQFIDWLDTFVNDFNSIQYDAERMDVSLSVESVEAFLEKIGINCDSNTIENECCTGRFYTLWLKKGTKRHIIQEAKKTLEVLRAELYGDVDTVELVERVAFLEERVEALLTKCNEYEKQIKTEKEEAERRYSKLSFETAVTLDNHKRLMHAIHNPPDEQLFAGPFIVKGNEIIAITEINGKPLPYDFYRSLLEHLKTLETKEVFEVTGKWLRRGGFYGSRIIENPVTPELWEQLWKPGTTYGNHSWLEFRFKDKKPSEFLANLVEKPWGRMG